MRFLLTDEQRDFGRSLDAMLTAADTPTAIRAWAAGDPGPGLALWARLAEAGVFALAVPEPYEGLGPLPVELAVAFLELGRHGVPGPVVETVAAAALLTDLARRGEPGPAKRLLPALASGDTTATLTPPSPGATPVVTTRPAGADPTPTSATPVVGNCSAGAERVGTTDGALAGPRLPVPAVPTGAAPSWVVPTRPAQRDDCPQPGEGEGEGTAPWDAGPQPGEGEGTGPWDAGPQPGEGEGTGPWDADPQPGDGGGRNRGPQAFGYALDADVAGVTLVVDGDQLRIAAAHGPVRASADPARRLARPAPGGELLATGPAVAAAVAHAQDWAMLATAAQALGVGLTLLDRTVAYAKQRTQFGTAIGSFQAVKHRLADTLIGLEFARPLLFGAALTFASTDLAAAKVTAGEAAYAAARTALQIHGAVGYTEELDLSLWLRKARPLRDAWGTPAQCRARVVETYGGS